jgi:dihydrodipicolinate synthase/N-acetylneuraminate lyase
VPNLAIVVYDNPDAFKGPIPTSVYARLSHIPQFVAAKYIAITPKFHQDMEAIGERMRLLPIEADWFAAKALWPDSLPGCWSSTALCGPGPVVALARMMAQGRSDEAFALTKRIGRTYETFLAMRNWPEFVKYNIPLEKLRFDEAGFIKAGPGRHPYQKAPSNYEEGSIEMARRWVALCEQYPAAL